MQSGGCWDSSMGPTPSRAPTTESRHIRPHHNWHSISGRPSPVAGGSRRRRRSIGGYERGTTPGGSVLRGEDSEVLLLYDEIMRQTDPALRP